MLLLHQSATLLQASKVVNNLSIDVRNPSITVRSLSKAVHSLSPTLKCPTKNYNDYRSCITTTKSGIQPVINDKTSSKKI